MNSIVNKISKENLDEKSLTNRQVIEMLQELSLEVYRASFSTVIDVVEVLTGDRNFEI